MTGITFNNAVSVLTLPHRAAGVLLAAFLLLLLVPAIMFAQYSMPEGENTLVVDDAAEMEVIAYGKTVIVKERAKGVLTFGGDIVVEGHIEGDVAAIGGSVIQKQNGYIGGDLFVLGGKYQPESANPLRAEGKETLLYAGYEEELREIALNPTSLLTPSFTMAFFTQRVLSVLFWFLVSLAIVTIAPGAVGRASARIQLTPIKVVGLGLGTFVLSTFGIIGSLTFLPNYLSAVLGIMAFTLLLLAYVFGRVALHVAFGKLLQKYIFHEGRRSETVAILLGVVLWTVILSVPFLWTFAVIALFSVGIGLVFTARSQKGVIAR